MDSCYADVIYNKRSMDEQRRLTPLPVVTREDLILKRIIDRDAIPPSAETLQKLWDYIEADKVKNGWHVEGSLLVIHKKET